MMSMLSKPMDASIQCGACKATGMSHKTSRACAECQRTYCGACKGEYMMTKKKSMLRRLSIGTTTYSCKSCASGGAAGASGGGAGGAEGAGAFVKLPDTTTMAVLESIRARAAEFVEGDGVDFFAERDRKDRAAAQSLSEALRTAEDENGVDGVLAEAADVHVMTVLVKKQLEQRNPLLPPNAFNHLVSAVREGKDYDEQIALLLPLVPYLRPGKMLELLSSTMQLLFSLTETLAVLSTVPSSPMSTQRLAYW